MRKTGIAIAYGLALTLSGCETTGGNGRVKLTPPDAIKLGTPFGTLEFSFGKEEQRPVASASQLEKVGSKSTDSLQFRAFDFDTGALPEGCKPFEAGKYGYFAFPGDGAVVEAIRNKVRSMAAETGAPDEAAIALAIYDARAFQSVCGAVATAKFKAGSQINGWVLSEKALAQLKTIGQAEIDVTPRIVIIALDKQVFKGRLKPNSVNVLLSKFRFEVPPNSDSLAFEPKTGAAVLAYSMDFQNVLLGNATRDFAAGGFLRIFVGKNYIYLIDFSMNSAGVSAQKWKAYQDYANSFRYISPGD